MAVQFGPFFDKKMKSFFRRVDANGNGLLSSDDFEMLADRYIKFGQLKAAEAKQIRAKLIKVWDDLFRPLEKNGSIDEDTFIQAIKVSEDKILEQATGFYEMWFDVIDLDQDGVIQKEEFTLFLKVFRVENKADAEQAFKVIDTNKDGRLSKEEFIKTGCQFSMSNDESLPSKYMFGPLI